MSCEESKKCVFICRYLPSHCLNLDLNDQMKGVSSDDGFISKEINQNNTESRKKSFKQKCWAGLTGHSQSANFQNIAKFDFVLGQMTSFEVVKNNLSWSLFINCLWFCPGGYPGGYPDGYPGGFPGGPGGYPGR